MNFRNDQKTEWNIDDRKRCFRRLARRDKRIAGLERKIQQLESALASRTMDLGSLSRNIQGAVQDALCNVRMIPVHGLSKTDKIVGVTTINKPQ